MQNKFFNKSLVIIPILLMIGASVAPCIDGYIVIKQYECKKQAMESKIQDLLHTISQYVNDSNNSNAGQLQVGEDGKLNLNIENQNRTEQETLNITLETNPFTIINTSGDKQEIVMEEFNNILVPGYPKLPSKTFLIGLPPGGEILKVELTKKNIQIFPKNYNIIMAPPVSSDNSQKIDNKLFNSSEFYPTDPVQYLGMGQMRKYCFGIIRFNPFLYSPSDGKLILYKNITLKITYFIKNHLSEVTLADTISDSFALQQIYNYNSIAPFYRIDNKTRANLSGRSSENYDFLIIYSKTILHFALNSFIVNKESMGHKIKSIYVNDIYSTTPGDDKPQKIRNYISNEWGNDNNLQYVLIVGSPQLIPMRTCYPNPNDHSPNGRYPTDYYYADLTGDWDSNHNGYYGEYGQDTGIDFYPEVSVGRIPFDDFGQVAGLCWRIINFQSCTSDWKNKVLLLGAISNYANEDGSGCAKTDGAVLMQRCLTQIYNPQGYIKTTMYEEEGLSPSTYPCDYKLTQANVNAHWPNGYGLVNINAHGYNDYVSRKVWIYDNGDGIPENNQYEMSWPNFFTSDDCSVLPSSMPSLVYTCSCDNANGQYSDNLIFSFLKHGAVGCIGSTSLGWYTVGWQDESYGGSASLDYWFFHYLINSWKTTGDALNSAKYYYYQNYNWYWPAWANLFGFCLYGDPTLLANKLPDIVITADDISFSGFPTHGAQTTITTKVHNDGLTNANSFQVKFWEKKQDETSWTQINQGITIPNLASGQTTTVSTTWIPPDYGSYDILAVGDANGDVNEADENNNDGVQSCLVLPRLGITPSCSYSESDQTLFISASIKDIFKSILIPPFTVSWELVGESYSGTMQCSKVNGYYSLWTDVEHSITLPYGDYTLKVTVTFSPSSFTESNTYSFNVYADQAAIQGIVYDYNPPNNPIENANVTLFKLVDIQLPFQYLLTPIRIVTKFTDSNGYYSFNNVPNGRYRLRVTKENYFVETEDVIITGGETKIINFYLSTDVKGVLLHKSNEFSNELNLSLSYETDTIGNIKSKINSLDDLDTIFNIVDWASTVLDIGSGAAADATPSQISNIKFWTDLGADWKFMAKTDADIILKAMTKDAFDTMEHMILAPKVDSLPTADQIRNTDGYKDIWTTFKNEYQNLAENINTKSIPSDFNTSLATDSLQKEINVLQNEVRTTWGVGQQLIYLCFPGVQKSYICVPGNYMAFYDAWKHVKDIKDQEQAQSIFSLLVSALIFLVAIVSAGTLAVFLECVLLIKDLAETASSFLLEFQMLNADEQMGYRVLSVLKSFLEDCINLANHCIDVYSQLKIETDTPYYFNKNYQFKAEPSIDFSLLNRDYTQNGECHFVYLPDSISEQRMSTITITNTGNSKTDFLVNVKDLDNSIIFSKRITDLQSGHSDVIEWNYNLPAIENPGSEQESVVTIEVYAGGWPEPFTYDEKYIVYRPQNSEGKNNPDFSNYHLNSSLILDTNLADTNGSAETNFTVGQGYASVDFTLCAPGNNVNLYVINQTGFYIGYNWTAGGIVTGFPADYTYLSSDVQKVHVPDATNETYTIRTVVANPSLAGQYYPVKVYATLTPFRPAIMSVSPMNLTAISHSNTDFPEEIPLVLYIKEIGEQSPLQNVTIFISNFTKGSNIISVNEHNHYIGNITPGSWSIFTIDAIIPVNAPIGDYIGTIKINASNAVNITMQSHVIIDNVRPSVSPNPTLYEHGASALLNDTITLNATASDGNGISQVIVDTSQVSTTPEVVLTKVSNTNFYMGNVTVDNCDAGLFYHLPVFASDIAGNINDTESIFVITKQIHPTLYVGGTGPNNYTTIQNAINQATTDDIIYVYHGTYNENLYINHSIGGLFGENKNTTIINSNSNYAIQLWKYAEYFSISNFTIINTNSNGNAVILIQECKNLILSNNIIKGTCALGVWLYSSNNNLIYRNDIKDLNYAGICLQNSSYENTINGNTIHNMYLGIYTLQSNSNTIFNNNFNSNSFNAYDQYTNKWNNTYPYAGNYWDDYTGVDHKHGPKQNISGPDGIGDTPYYIPGGSNKDYYPLMNNISVPVANFEYFCNDLNVSFDASSSHVNYGGIVSYEWEFGDASNGTGKVISHSYLTYGTHVVTLTITDNNGNKNTTSKQVILFDLIPPELSYVQSNPITAESGSWVNITCRATDNVQINEIKANITFSSNSENVTLMNIYNTDIYYYNTTYDLVGTYTYFIWAIDSSGNEQISTQNTFAVQEIIPVPPEIIDNTLSEGYTGDLFIYNATVTDLGGVSSVWVEYWYGTGNHTNITMNKVNGDYWQKTITIANTLDTLHYFISANDTSDNWNNTGIKNITIYDNDCPEITQVEANPMVQVPGGNVNISTTVTDNIGVNSVYLNIRYPDMSIKNLSITQNNTDDTYYCNSSYDQPGIYVFYIWAKDTSQNANSSSNYSFEIRLNNPPYEPSDPSPGDGATGVDVNVNLSWSGGDPDGDPVTYDVYFGINSPPQKMVSNQSATTYHPGTMAMGTLYYWKIVAWDNQGASTAGPIWNFTTKFNSPPNQPSNPNPPNGATGISINTALSWTGGDPDGDPVTYDVCFGKTTPPPKIIHNQSSTSYNPGTLDFNSTYFWQIIAWDNHNTSTAGQIWNFTTGIELSYAFLLGFISNKTDTGAYITFKAVKLFYLDFTAFDHWIFNSGEQIIVSNDYLGYIGPKFIIGVFEAAVINNLSHSFSSHYDRSSISLRR